ncbi:furin-like protease 2 isoform X2 [Musca domestica]|uniref:Furin-like protease 2 isoform X2 n=1 Tax=Musca domestica TaxID=7370 RepID=A0ABM3UX93_MUSDO|nr:furin-like protease 2 isoform X2 [Musca domestica]
MNLYHNPNNDDECDNSISSQCEINTENVTSNTAVAVATTTNSFSTIPSHIWQCEDEQLTTATNVNFRNGKLSSQSQALKRQAKTVSMSWALSSSSSSPSSSMTEGDVTPHNGNAGDAASTVSRKLYHSNTCPEEKKLPVNRAATATTAAAASYIHQTQKWRERPRGRYPATSKRKSNSSSISSCSSPSKPVIWNLFNFGKMHHHLHRRPQPTTTTLTQLCKYFLVMLVILPSVLAVPSLELQQQQQPNALPSSQGKFVKTNNGATTSTTGNKVTTTSTAAAAAGAAAISQHVNSSNNQQNSNNNNNSDNDLYITSNAMNATNSAVKIILNDYSDAFSQIINNENEQQQQQQLHSGHQNSTSPDDYLFDFHDDLLDSFRGTHSLPRQPMYTNEFAVHIPAGPEMADIIANKYGFTNMGQIGALKDYYLFHHKRVSKRSLRTSDEHHKALNSEPEVRWIQQQHEKIRHKRDGSYSSLPGYSPYDILRQTTAFGGLPSLHVMSGPDTSYRNGLTRAPRIQYRDAGPHTIFPDPLFKEQWYLNGGAKDGLDMNIGPAWQKGYTGKGVVVSILDDGIQKNHPDLAQNYDPDASFDINGNDSDPTPQDNGDNKHGTRCAGEVAGVAFNNYCGVGVAYNASIGGVRMLDGKVNDVVEAQALSLNPSHIDIYSASWGPEDDGSTVDGPGPLARRAFIYGVTSGRQGKGSIFVWASGNGGRYTDSCNCDGYTNSIFTLSISSATQGGFKPWYLEECSSTLATTYSSGTPGHDKSVATVDMDGRLRPDHICTVEHTGTSASAPLAAGICALALEANPNLTWRDMQYLVVYTSRPAPLEKESGWMLNGVKRKYSHKFGYGLMDAGAMVSLAEQWTTVPPQHICKSRENNEDRKIEGTYGYTLATHMDVNGCAGTINEVRYLEHVQCRITLRFFPRGNLRILLTSPMGTTSTLLFERPRDIIKSNFDDWPFLSVHFWGEKAEGRWTLQIINGGRRRVNQPGILSKWQLIFYGTAVQPMRLKSDLVSQPIRDPVYTFPTESDLGQPINTDQFSSFLNFQNLYTGAGSNPEQAVTTVDGHNIPTPQRQNVMADSNNKLVLHDCDPECDSQGCYGRGPTQCVACKHYRLDNTCVSRCPPRSFPNQGGVCWPCHESCETCAGAGQDSCLTCAPAHLHVTDLAVCLQVCPEGYYENYDNKTCVPCEANCGSCQDRPDYCTSCEHHLVMHEHKCFSSCPLHTYETEEYNCAPCHSSCATCNGSAESQCITCRSGRFAHDGKCLNSCPDGYYADKKRQECVACPTGCATCTTNGFCLTCQDNWTRNKKGKCIITGSENCDESEYYDNNHCHPCHSTCETCDGPTESNCLSCPQSLLLQNNHCVSTCDDGYYMEAGVCAKCLHTCTQCVSRMNCTACAKGLQLQSGECRTTCADGYYSDRGTCAKCYLSCHTCSGPRRDQCVQCPSGWQLAGGECHPECPEGFYKSEFGCQKCHHYCKTCNGAGPLACTSCPAHFMLDGGLCMECLGSQYYDSPTQTCKTCHESCRSCTGPGQYSCQTCAFPLHLDRLNNQCVPCCANDASPEDQSCCHCDKDTGGCINASPAGKRRIAAAAEQQQFGSSYGNSGGLYGNLLDDSDGSTGVGALFSRVGSPLTTITAIAVAACLLIVTVFAVIFAVLQRSSNQAAARKTIRYNKVPTNNRRRNRITSSSTLLKVDAEANIDDEDDEEEAVVDYHDEEEEDEEEVYERDLQQCQTQTPTLAEDDDDDEDLDDLELFDKNTKINIDRKQRKQRNQQRQTMPSSSQGEENELHTFVRVPLKKTSSSSLRQMSSSSSEDKTQRT